MGPKNSLSTEDQGALFSEQVVHSGETDPEFQTTSYTYEASPEGIYPSESQIAEAVAEDPDFVKNVKEAVKTQHRRAAQTGRHSPLERDGSYLNVQVGDYLPDFGPVTYRNFPRAEEHARSLEADRNNPRT